MENMFTGTCMVTLKLLVIEENFGLFLIFGGSKTVLLLKETIT